MALANVYTSKRSDIGAIAGIPFVTPNTRGMILNGYQTESQVVTKLTGDATGNITLGSIRRPAAVFVEVLKDNAGADQTTLSLVNVAFTHTNDTTIALSGLGNWTRGRLVILGRAYN